MTGYSGPIEKQTLKNNFFRQVLFTGRHAQLVVMCLQPGEEIGNEVHNTVDQFFRIEQGEAKFVLNGREVHVAKDGDAVIVGRHIPQRDKCLKNRKSEIVYDIFPAKPPGRNSSQNQGRGSGTRLTEIWQISLSFSISEDVLPLFNHRPSTNHPLTPCTPAISAFPPALY